MYKYIHDAQNRVVYKIPNEPTVIDQNDKHGKRTGWSVNMEILITRADNRLNSHRWQHPISAYPSQSFDAHHTKEEVISHFLMSHEPDGDDISLEQYTALQAQYEAIARNQPND